MAPERSWINRSALFATVLWSGAFVAGKLALPGFGPIGLVGIRYLVGAPLLALFLSGSDWRALRQPSPHRRQLLLAVLFNASNQLLWPIGIQSSTATHGVLLYAASPIWAALCAAAMGQDRLRRHVVAGVIVAFAGVGLVVWRGLDVGGATLLGDGLIFAGAVAFAVSNTLVARPMRYYGPFTATAAVALVGGVVSLPLIVISLVSLSWGTIPSESWLGLGYAVFGAFIIGQVFWYRGIAQIGSTQTMIYAYLQPVFGLMLAASLLGERLEPIQLAGAVVVLAGVATAQGRLNRRVLLLSVE